jgi:hypothetical protein
MQALLRRAWYLCKRTDRRLFFLNIIRLLSFGYRRFEAFNPAGEKTSTTSFG